MPVADADASAVVGSQAIPQLPTIPLYGQVDGPLADVAALFVEQGLTIAIAVEQAETPIRLSLDGTPAGLAMQQVAAQMGDGASVWPRPGGVWYLGPPTGQDEALLVLDLSQGDADDWIGFYQAAASEKAHLASGGRDRLVVRASPSAIERLRELHSAVLRPRRQFEIVATFVELNQAAARELGLDVSPAATASVELSTTVVDASAAARVEATLAAAVSRGDGRVVTAPRLHIVEGSEGSVEVGDRIPVPFREVSPYGQVSTSRYEFIQTGVKLHVEARPAGEAVRLLVEPEVSQQSGSVENVPIVSTRRVSSSAVMMPGGLLVLGGLDLSQENDDATRTPYLPFLGRRKQTRLDRRLYIVVRLDGLTGSAEGGGAMVRPPGDDAGGE